MTFGGHGSEVLTVQEHVALSQRDHTADTLARVADELGPHLPVRDQRVGEACKLLSALRQARRSSDAARILLCDRLVEQVAGWAGVADRAYFLQDHLRPAWSYRRIRSEIADVGWAAQYAFSEQNHGTDGPWSAIFPDNGAMKVTMNFQALLDHLPWVIDQLPEGSERRHAERLRSRTSTGSATLSLHESDRRFDVIDSRARRTRNALAHGGPTGQRMAAPETRRTGPAIRGVERL